MIYHSDAINICIEIDAMPPSVNCLYHNGACRQMYLTKQHRLFRKVVADAVGQERCPWQFVEVDITLTPPDKRRRDIDNYTKGLFDALTHAGFWQDDDIVKILHIRWAERPGDAHTKMMIRQWRNTADEKEKATTSQTTKRKRS